MANTRTRKKHVFAALYISVFLIGVILLAAGARVITSFLVDYEASRPENFIAAYENSFDEAHVRSIAGNINVEYDHNLMTADTFREMFIKDFAYNAKFECKRNGALCVGNRMGYHVLADGVRAGTLVIEQEYLPEIRNSDWLLRFVSGKLASILGCSYGKWTIVSEEFEFTAPSVEPVKVSVPPDWSVRCNGYKLDESYIVGEPSIIPSFSEYYQDFDLPYLITYQVNSYIGDSKLEVFDPNGRPVELSERPEDNDMLFVGDFFDNDNQEIVDFTAEFIKRFTAYGSNVNGDRYGNLANLRRLIVPETDFESRMIQAIDGLYYAHSRSNSITDLKINAIIRYDEYWFVDFTYTMDTTGNKGVVSTTHNARINVIWYEGSLRVERMVSY